MHFLPPIHISVLTYTGHRTKCPPNKIARNNAVHRNKTLCICHAHDIEFIFMHSIPSTAPFTLYPYSLPTAFKKRISFSFPVPSKEQKYCLRSVERTMARRAFMFLVALLAAHHEAAARVLPTSGKGLADQKNYFSFGGVGGYGGIGPTGIPYGGVGGGAGTGGVLGGPPLTAIGGVIGTRPDGRLVGAGGTIPGGVVTIGGGGDGGGLGGAGGGLGGAGGGLGGAGGGLGGAGGGGGTGVLPNP